MAGSVKFQCITTADKVLKHHVTIIYLNIHISVYCLNICYFFVSELLSRIRIKALASLYQISMKGDFEGFKSDWEREIKKIPIKNSWD